ncbi:MAG: YfhO family protein [Thermoanaerobaculia bacterium]
MIRWKWRAILIALAALAPFIPMLLGGDVPSFRDHRDYFVPLREATAIALRGGELPLWNALSGSGEPWLANPQTGVFYPPAWLVAALPFRTGYVLFLVFHLALLGFGWRRLVLRWVRDDVATLSACALVLSGPVLSLLDVSNSLGTFAWIPLLLSFALDGGQRAPARDAATIALCFLGGEPLLAAAGAALYAVVRLVRERRAALLGVAAVAALSILLSAAQLLPFLESLRGSDRSSGLDSVAALAQSLAPVDWMLVPVAPSVPGSATIALTSQRFLPSIFISPLLALLPLALPLLWRGGMLPSRACFGWLALFGVSAFLAAGAHLAPAKWFYLAAGLTVNRYPVKFALFGFLAIVALGAICLDRLLEGTRRTALAGAVAAVMAAVIVILLATSRSPAATQMLALWAAAIVIVLVARPPRRWLLVVATLVVAADSISASRFLLVGSPLAAGVEPHATILQRERKVARLEQFDLRRDRTASRAGRAAWLGGYLNLRNQQFDAMTAAPVVDVRYLEIVGYALARPRIDILDFFGVGYLFTTREISGPGYREVLESGGVRVYERAAGFPSVTVWERVVPEPDRAAAYASLYSETWNARDQIVVTGESPPLFADAAIGPVGSGRIADVSWSSIRVEVESPRGGVVALSQRDAPGWSVTVDGTAAEPLVVNGIFRGVAVPAGRHEVEWRYFPRSLSLGFLLSVTGITIAGITLFRRREAGIAQW